MTIKGTFRKGVVVPEKGRKLPDGTEVEMLVRVKRPLREAIRFAGTIKGPRDWAKNHDHYLYGTRKK